MLPSRVGILRNERTQSYYLDSKLLFSCVLFYLGAFGTVWLPYSVQNGQNWCTSSCHEVESEFFETNATDPPHWTLNSCFGAFHTILMHLGPFGWLAKLDGKRAELMQKIVPRSYVIIFRNERTQSIPLDPKLLFLCVSYYLGAFE